MVWKSTLSPTLVMKPKISSTEISTIQTEQSQGYSHSLLMLTGFCSVMCGVSKVVSVDLMCDHVFFQGKGRWVIWYSNKNVVLSNMLFGFHNRRYACILVIKPLSSCNLKNTIIDSWNKNGSGQLHFWSMHCQKKLNSMTIDQYPSCTLSTSLMIKAT